MNTIAPRVDAETALERLPQLKQDGSFAGWVFQIARNAVNDVHRRRPTESLHDALADPDEQPGFTRTLRRCVVSALGRCLVRGGR
jgi:DNA-directed RNA polymerase specialized sigma24 family protein